MIASDPNNTAETERIQTAFVKKFGISEDAFKKAYHSFAVETALQRADQLVQRYRIDGVPTFVVNGKYVVDVRKRRRSGAIAVSGRRPRGAGAQALADDWSAPGRVSMVTHAGGCHCGRVRFEVLAPAQARSGGLQLFDLQQIRISCI